MIKVRNLSYTYEDSQVKAVDDISFNITKGEIFGFLGPSGAGKSTTQKVLIRLLDNYQGQVEIFGQNLQSFGSEIYEKIGVGFEVPNHFLKLTGEENLRFFMSLYQKQRDDVDTILERVGLLESKNEKVESYSKGMKVRLNFVRAMLNDPQIIFLDEPTAGLDPVNARIIKEFVIEEKNKGKTIFITTHNMQVADDLCDKVAFIVDGKIVEMDNPKELKLKHGEKKVKLEYYRDQEILTRDFPLNTFGNDEEFLDIVKNRTIRTIHSQETTLEEVFIKVTGRSLK